MSGRLWYKHDPVGWMSAKIDASGPCWEWMGGRSPAGYGAFNNSLDLPRLAHRAVWVALCGPLTPDIELHHECRNRACVNPDHLVPLTRAEHQHEFKVVRNGHESKTHCKHGHPYSGPNLYLRPDRPGWRGCRTCIAAANKRYESKRVRIRRKS